MPLYSVTHFSTTGAAVSTDTPVVTSNPLGIIPYTSGMVLPNLEKLTMGTSTVVAIRKSASKHLIEEGYRIKLLPYYVNNHVYYDAFARENVLVTNGICVLDHSSPEGYAASHEGPGISCIFKALECHAIRPTIDSQGNITVGTVMRLVDHAYLNPVLTSQEIAKAPFDLVMAQYEMKKSKKLTSKVRG